ncbi:TPA_asm: hypothetical protein GZX72_14675 [Listeria monocytogenes]|nr:hypothetical protein [Listeria monocytogenes]
MINRLNNRIQDLGYDTEADNEGVYLQDYDLDIVVDDSDFILSTQHSNYVTTSIDETVSKVKDISNISDVESSLIGIPYQLVDDTHIYIMDYTVFSEDGKLWLEGTTGELEQFTKASDVISGLEEINMDSQL